jgi:hypothetical protein
MNTTALVLVITLIAGGISQAGDYYIYRDGQGRTWLSNQDPRKEDDSTGKRPKDVTIIDRYQWQDGPSGQLAGSQIETPPPVKKMTK